MVFGNDTLTGDNYYSNADLFVFKGTASNLSNFGNDTITDFQVGIDTARLFLNNSDIISEDTIFFWHKIDVGNSSISFDWLTKNQFRI